MCMQCKRITASDKLNECIEKQLFVFPPIDKITDSAQKKKKPRKKELHNLFS